MSDKPKPSFEIWLLALGYVMRENEVDIQKIKTTLSFKWLYDQGTSPAQACLMICIYSGILTANTTEGEYKTK